MSERTNVRRLALAAMIGLGTLAASAFAVDEKPIKNPDQPIKPPAQITDDAKKAIDAAKGDAAKAIEGAKNEATKAADAVKGEAAKPDADGFVEIFNGKDLTGWEGLPDFWSVKDGAITATEVKEKSKQTFLVYQGGDVGDFEIRYKYKYVTKEGNSGLQFRSKVKDAKGFVVGGYQADCDAGNGFTGIIYDEAGVAGGRGIMSNRGEKTHWDADNKRHNEKLPKSGDEIKAAIKPVGEWNDCVLTVKGNHIVYSINGQVTTELTDESPKALKSGVLAFQCHAGFTMEIQFKDIKLKKLDAAK